VKSALFPAAKRKLANVQPVQADFVLQSLLEDAAAAHHSCVKKVLVVDVGGTAVKILAMGQTETRGFQSGPKLTPERMVSGVKNPLRIGGTMSCRSAILAPSWPAGPQRSPLTRGGAGSNRCWHGRLPSSPTCSARFRKTSTRRAWSNFSWRSLRHRGDHGPVESSFSTSVRQRSW